MSRILLCRNDGLQFTYFQANLIMNYFYIVLAIVAVGGPVFLVSSADRVNCFSDILLLLCGDPMTSRGG